MKCSMPKNQCSCTSDGHISVIPWIFSGSGLMPSMLKMVQYKVIFGGSYLTFITVECKPLSVVPAFS